MAMLTSMSKAPMSDSGPEKDVVMVGAGMNIGGSCGRDGHFSWLYVLFGVMNLLKQQVFTHLISEPCDIIFFATWMNYGDKWMLSP